MRRAPFFLLPLLAVILIGSRGDALVCQSGADCNAPCLTGVCDENGSCVPVDAGAPCPDDDDPCTLDQCDGNGGCQHPAGNAGAVCRPAAGLCDVVERCTGASPDCPADGFESSKTICQPATDECDADDFCSGDGPDCGADLKQPSGTACTADADPCTKDECDGVHDACQHPAGNAGATCRPINGACDVAEVCTGTSAGCPPDAKRPASVVCRPPVGPCDVAESCDGVGSDCPPNAFAPSSMPCRAAAGRCDVAETCSGSGPDCPPDAKQPDATPCDDGNACTRSDVCRNGVCTGENPVVCTAVDLCHEPGTCSPTTGVCSTPSRAEGTTCDDGNPCTIGDRCRGGSCSGTSVPGCCVDDTACDDGVACTADRCVACAAGQCLGNLCVHAALDDRCGPGADCALPVCAPGTPGADARGCLQRPVDGATFCSEDSDPCTVDTCRAGTCIHDPVTSSDCPVLTGPFRALRDLASRAGTVRAAVASASDAVCTKLVPSPACLIVAGSASPAPRLLALLDAANGDFDAAIMALGGRLPGASAPDASLRVRLALGLLANTPGELRAFIATTGQGRSRHVIAAAFARGRQAEVRTVLRRTNGLRAQLRRIVATRRTFAR